MTNMHNKVMDQTQKVVSKSISLSKRSVESLTKPPKKVALVGSSIGMVLGALMLIMGLIWLFASKTGWAISALIFGLATIISNVINIKKYM